MYQLIIKPKAKKTLFRLHPKDRETALERVGKLRDNPFDPLLQAVKLADTQRSYRIRIGRIRIIYELFIEEKIIFVRLVDYRRSGTYKSPWR